MTIRNMKFVVIFLMFVVQKECESARPWNVDQNRLEVSQTIDGQHLPYHASQKEKFPTPYNGRYDGYRQTIDRRYPKIRNRQIEYSREEPKIITASIPQRNIYKSLEDPSTIYKNQVFRNLTEREKSQLKWNTKETTSNNVANEGPNLKHLQTIPSESFTDENSWMENSFNNRPKPAVQKLCVRCPAEQTAIAQKGRERVRLTHPKLTTCDDEDVPFGVKFQIMYGPRIGSLLTEGSHLAVASIVYQNKTLQLCQYRYNVIVRRCPAIGSSPEMIVKCPHNGAWGTGCRFKCSRPDVLARGGPPRIICDDSLRWSAPIPQCKESNRPWCETKAIARMGRITCETALGKIHLSPNTLPEGSTCTVQCKKRHHLQALSAQNTTPESKVVCQNGLWKGQINECPKLNRDRRRKRNWAKQHRPGGH